MRKEIYPQVLAPTSSQEAKYSAGEEKCVPSDSNVLLRSHLSLPLTHRDSYHQSPNQTSHNTVSRPSDNFKQSPLI